jgi:SET domain
VKLIKIIFQTCLLLCDEFAIPSSLWLPVAAIFLKLDLVLCFNNRNIDTLKVNYTSVENPLKILREGFCLPSSLVNHSCDPNMYIISYGDTSVFRARRPISKGEQLTMIYANPATIYTYSVRQKQLLENYKFVCT